MSSQWFGNCEGVTRRAFVRLGALTAFGVSTWGRTADAIGPTHPFSKIVGAGDASATFGRARRCILIWLDGGPSHLDTFDPKPEAAGEIRGPLGSIATAIPGVRLNECLPRTAALLDQVTIIRSLTSPLGEHNLATQYLLTGHPPNPALDYPVLGSVVAHLKEEQTLPTFVSIPHHRVGGVEFPAAGFLASRCRPFETDGDPRRSDFSVPGLTIHPELGPRRLNRRVSFVERLNAWQRGMEQAADARPQVWSRAAAMLTDPQVRAAFSLESESATARQTYGLTTVGQGCLLAKRLVERGVSFVTVNFPGWDTHDAAVVRLKDGYAGATTPVGLVPQLDQALAGLLMDLQRSGLLEETLVVVMGEFGRTPKVNATGGRDHWPRAFSALLAGGGVPGGQIIGATDRHGQSPVADPASPADLAASVYWLLGIDPFQTLETTEGRPIRIVDRATLIAGLTG